jgi:hypothetical protein
MPLVLLQTLHTQHAQRYVCLRMALQADDV